jgi:cell division protease FtsH
MTPKENNNNIRRQQTFLVWAIIIGLITFLFVIRDKTDSTRIELKHKDFVGLIESNLVISGHIYYNPQSPELREITGKFKSVSPNGSEQILPFRLKTKLSPTFEEKLLMSGKFEVEEPNTFVTNLFYGILPFVVVAFLIYFLLMRHLKVAGKNAFNFGRSKAKLWTKEKNKVTFKDVAGIEEAKEEVLELVEFLKDPKKFQKLGARIPKGVLMVGPPGTGKTLLAKAIAGEADAAFFSISGSDFVEMFVGVGASRVRDMFEQARQNTPCLVFIDEIDAVGRSRGHGLGGGNDEREQTLNALLVEMDGFDTQEGIIVIAATNRPDVLDPALLRPGRFDRQIVISMPDVKGREEILKVHARKVKLDPSVNLSIIARGTPGYSGADLANLINEAALLAAKANKKFITMAELEEARDKVRWGRERRSLAMSESEKRTTAWHEAGHALATVLLEHTHPLHKVTIIPRGQALGATMSLPERDIWNHTKKEMLDMITVTMAGRIAEEIALGDISTGASNDIQQATQIARSMVCQWGMSEKLGLVQYGDESEYVFLGKEMIRNKGYSESTAKEIDLEVKRIIDECCERARKLIIQNKDKLDRIANALLEHETLDGKQVMEIIKFGDLHPDITQTSATPSDAQNTDKIPTTSSELPDLGSPAHAPI